MPIVDLGPKYQQERPVNLINGPDGMIYVGTIPSKGVLGGALVRINPKDLSYKVYRNIIPKQSIVYLASCPTTGEIFGVSDITGGTGVVPTEREAYIFLWDPKKEEVVFKTKPIPGSGRYGDVACSREGIIYCMTTTKYFAFDPKNRKMAFIGDLPAKGNGFPLFDQPIGPQGMIYGITADMLFTIDPADNDIRVIARHDTLKKLNLGENQAFITAGGIVYYGFEEKLMRAQPKN